MAFQAKNVQKANSLNSQDWDLLRSDSDESFAQQGQERLSVASLSSDDADAVIIFGGKNSFRDSTMQSPSTSVRERNNVLDDRRFTLLDSQQKKLYSDITNDPVLQRVASGSIQPVEYRLFQQISKLEEKLEEAEGNKKVLLEQNKELTTANRLLKQELEELLSTYISLRKEIGNGKMKDPTIQFRRTSIAIVTGIGLIFLLKKRLVLSGFGVISGFLLANSLGIFRFDDRAKDQELKRSISA